MQMVTIALSPEHSEGRCRIMHRGTWTEFVDSLPASLRMLELNCFGADMQLCSTAGRGFLSLFGFHARMPGAQAQVSLEAAFGHVADKCADEWEVKSWDGMSAHNGVVAGSRGFAMMRAS